MPNQQDGLVVELRAVLGDGGLQRFANCFE
jgi:hypothetical protein